MYPKVVKYNDFNGVEREETIYFNLTQAEVMEMELGTAGGFTALLTKMIKSPDQVALAKLFKDIILKSYGEKSDDGRYFRKVSDTGVPLSIAFSQSQAYSVIYMELLHDDEKAAEFIKGIAPVDVTDEDIAKATAALQ